MLMAPHCSKHQEQFPVGSMIGMDKDQVHEIFVLSPRALAHEGGVFVPLKKILKLILYVPSGIDLTFKLQDQIVSPT